MRGCGIFCFEEGSQTSTVRKIECISPYRIPICAAWVNYIRVNVGIWRLISLTIHDCKGISRVGLRHIWNIRSGPINGAGFQYSWNSTCWSVANYCVVCRVAATVSLRYLPNGTCIGGARRVRPRSGVGTILWRRRLAIPIWCWGAAASENEDWDQNKGESAGEQEMLGTEHGKNLSCGRFLAYT